MVEGDLVLGTAEKQWEGSWSNGLSHALLLSAAETEMMTVSASTQLLMPV